MSGPPAEPDLTAEPDLAAEPDPAAEPPAATRLGEGCWVFRFAEAASPEASARVLEAYRRVLGARAAGELVALDAVPGLTELGVHFDPTAADATAVREAVEAVLAAPGGDGPAPPPPRTHTLPTRFDGPDLAAVAERAGMGAAEVVERFTAPAYAVAAVGFLPHFPYLLGLDPRLRTPRRASPRTRVPAGSVAIGADQAGVYPRQSPGGWNLIGTTDPGRLEAIEPGDAVRFEATP